MLMMEFSDWITKKYLSWRGDRVGSGISVAAYAKFLCVSQPLMSEWMKPDGKTPTSKKSIDALFRVYGEGRKSRSVRFGDKALRALRRYLKTRTGVKPNDPLIATDGNGPLDRFSLRDLVYRRAEAAGVPHPGLHDFRRRGAYELWKKTRDLQSVSLYLGHSSTLVTRRYIALDDEDVLDAHRLGSPVDNGGF